MNPMAQLPRKLALAFATSLLIAVAGSSRAVGSAWQTKVAPQVLTAAATGSTEFLVLLRDQADLSRVALLNTKEEKGAYVFAQLTAMAADTQRPILQALDLLGAERRAYWIVNLVWARGGLAAVQALAERVDVEGIYANPEARLSQPLPAARPQAPTAIEANITHTGATAAWALGFRGQGAVVAGADTGVEWTHGALKGHYRGWNGTTANHNYNWHLGSVPNDTCSAFPSTEPCDDDTLFGGGHGSHTVGTMVGDDGGNNKIGMAPDAKWIACRNMDHGVGFPTTYLNCMQWFVAPTDINDANPDPSKAPDVINNSWGCVEACPPQALLLGTQAIRSAGIVYVASAGNEGPQCSTLAFAPAVFHESFTVGATDNSDTIADFSSRGPVLDIDPTPYRKPDVSAPGVNVRSSVRGGGYASLSGTSMSGPHVAGLVALLISADPTLRGNVDRIEEIIEQTAKPRTTTDGCGGDTSTTVPNNTFGYGVIDALAAVRLARPPGFFTLSPCRAFDSRVSGGPLASATERVITLGGICGVPVTATAVVLNATAIGSSAQGSVALYPLAGTNGPALVYFTTGQTRANNAVLGLASGGTLTAKAAVQGNGIVDLVLDVAGYFD